jgi:hypothetical protein
VLTIKSSSNHITEQDANYKEKKSSDISVVFIYPADYNPLFSTGLRHRENNTVLKYLAGRWWNKLKLTKTGPSRGNFVNSVMHFRFLGSGEWELHDQLRERLATRKTTSSLREQRSALKTSYVYTLLNYTTVV